MWFKVSGLQTNISNLLGQFRGKFEDRRGLVNTQLCLTRVDHFQGSLHCVLKKRSTTSDLMRRLFRSPRHVFTTKLQINLVKTCILQNFLLLNKYFLVKFKIITV